jgi:DNA polymerase III subunit epsilon
MTRQIVLDTETTGLDPKSGHRLIEIGAVELINRRVTSNRFHVYLNPQRPVDPGALAVHGLNDAFLADKPLFTEVLSDFLHYINDAELIIHNAAFDVGFLDHELTLANTAKKITDLCRVTDTLSLARTLHPGQKNSLDALCKRYRIDNSHRSLHGALLDAEILARVYLAMTGGQISLLDLNVVESPVSCATKTASQKATQNNWHHPVIFATAAELSAHEEFLQFLNKKSKTTCVWDTLGTDNVLTKTHDSAS